jgi:hypothetical protein
MPTEATTRQLVVFALGNEQDSLPMWPEVVLLTGGGA